MHRILYLYMQIKNMEPLILLIFDNFKKKQETNETPTIQSYRNKPKSEGGRNKQVR